MVMSGKFSDRQLRIYFADGFACGQPFNPAWQGARIVDADGELLDAFVRHIEENDGDMVVPYERMVAIFEGLRVPDDGSTLADKLLGYHRTLMWYAFHRRQGVTQERFAEKEGIHERTVHVRLTKLVKYFRRKLTAQPAPVVLPPSYQSWHQAAM